MNESVEGVRALYTLLWMAATWCLAAAVITGWSLILVGVAIALEVVALALRATNPELGPRRPRRFGPPWVVALQVAPVVLIVVYVVHS